MWIDLKAMRTMRLAEMDAVIGHLPKGKQILELGGGSGWQAARLESLGYQVASVDVAGNPYKGQLEFPVREYDGRKLPFADKSFDAIFSSNVLEHVDDLACVLAECARVLKPSGVAVHLMPTSSWRVLTLITHFPWLMGIAWKVLTRRASALPGVVVASRARTSHAAVLRKLLPVRHGEHGSFMSEICRFSARAWRQRLAACGWTVESDFPVGVAYSGYFVTYPCVGLKARRFLARVVGSGCHAYVVRPASGAQAR